MIDRVVVIGCGGTGSYLAKPLARLIRNLDRHVDLFLADGDSYSHSNMDRQSFAIDAVGKNKAEYQAESILKEMDGLNEKIYIVDQFLSEKDINDEVVVEGTMVINCADNNAIRKFAEDAIDKLKDGVHICCGNELRHGQVQVSAKENGERTCRSIYEDAPVFNSTDGDRSAMSCQDLANLPGGGQLISANMMAASLALNYATHILTKKTTKRLSVDNVAFDIMTNKFHVKDRVREDL